MHSRVLVELPSFGRNVWPICFPSQKLLTLLRPTECVKTGEMPCKLPKFRLSIWTFMSCAEDNFSEPNATGRTFSSLTVFFYRDCLQSWRHIQHFWSWHPLIRRAAFLECVVSVLTRKRHWGFYRLSQMFPSILT